MPKGELTIDIFCNPPEKVRRMYEAVSDLVRERTNISTIKVQDITERAGIGKGTAYQYFSSREEIIIMALFYEYGAKLDEVRKMMERISRFHDKINHIFDWLYENQDYNHSFMHIIRAATGSFGEKVCQKEKMPRVLLDGMNQFLFSVGDEIMEQGYREGAFTETDVTKRRLAFAAMLFQMILSFHDKKENPHFGMDYQEAREFAYQTLIKSLS